MAEVSKKGQANVAKRKAKEREEARRQEAEQQKAIDRRAAELKARAEALELDQRKYDPLKDHARANQKIGIHRAVTPDDPGYEYAQERMHSAVASGAWIENGMRKDIALSPAKRQSADKDRATAIIVEDLKSKGVPPHKWAAIVAKHIGEERPNARKRLKRLKLV